VREIAWADLLYLFAVRALREELTPKARVISPNTWGVASRSRALLYSLPQQRGINAESLLSLREASLISNTRYIVPWSKHVWEVDVFRGENEGS
jgi:CYTH domain-containing protein